MDENNLKQLLAEVIQAQADALGAITAAVCRCTDPVKLSSELEGQFKAMKATNNMSAITEMLLKTARAAAEAEKLLAQRKGNH